MSKLPCKKCPKCNRFNSLSAEKCSCGYKLNYVRGTFYDDSELTEEEISSLQNYTKLYTQTCRYCGTVYLIAEGMPSIKECYEDGGRMTGLVEYVEEPVNAADCGDKECSKEPESYLFENIMTNVKDTVGIATEAVNSASCQDNVESYIAATSEGEFDWPEEMQDMGLLKKNDYVDKNHEIVLRCTTNINLWYTFKVEDDIPYHIGRSERMKECLEYDDRISHDHCHLICSNGKWKVIDHSKAGTFVNRIDIGDHGECYLHDGDMITLGHYSDSISFYVRIKQ